METDQVVSMGRMMLLETAFLLAPVLGVAVLVSFLLSILQVLTSLQDQTLTAVPRLIVTGLTLFVLMPWMWRHLAFYTIRVLSDFHQVLR